MTNEPNTAAPSGSGSLSKETPRHCDDLIDDETQPAVLRDFLRYNRLPAVCKCAGMTPEDVERAKRHMEAVLFQHIDARAEEPALFADYNGKRVRVVMASRFGDVGITPDLTARRGYSERVMVSALTNFAAASSLECDAATDRARAATPPASEASPTEANNV